MTTQDRTCPRRRTTRMPWERWVRGAPRKGVGIVVALMCAAFAAALGVPAHAAAPERTARFAPAQVVNIVNTHSKLCMETPTSALGQPVRQGRCFGKPAARWYLKTSGAGNGAVNIVSAVSGTCVGVENASPAAGAALRLAECGSGPAVSFRIVSIGDGVGFQTMTSTTPRCLEVTESSTADGAALRQWDCNQQPGSLFAQQQPPRQWGTTLVNSNSGKCLGILDQSGADGARAIQRTCAGGTDQRWQVVELGEGKVAVVNENSGKCLAISNGSLDNGANANQFSCDGYKFHTWAMTPEGPTENSTFTLANLRSGKYLGIRGQSKDEAAQAEQWDRTTNPDQVWRMMPSP